MNAEHFASAFQVLFLNGREESLDAVIGAARRLHVRAQLRPRVKAVLARDHALGERELSFGCVADRVADALKGNWVVSLPGLMRAFASCFR